MSEKSAVSSNYKKFNKGQQALIKRFGLSVNSGVSDIANALFGIAEKDSFQTFPGVTGAPAANPVTIKGKKIFNPIWPIEKNEKFKARADKKKFVIRTGKLKQAFASFKSIDGNYKGLDVMSRIVSPGKLQFGFMGRTRMILLVHARKEARIRRRPVELAMSKIRGIAKKLIANRIAMAVNNV